MVGWREVQHQVVEQVDEVSQWTRRLATEVKMLPDTMFRLRDGARNFQIAGERLASSAKSLDAVSSVYAKTVTATVGQSMSVLEQLQGQVGKVSNAAVAPDATAQISRQIRDVIDAMSALNPLWPSGVGGQPSVERAPETS